MKQLNIQSTVHSLVSFIRETFLHTGFSDAVIALSGGIDSATSFALAVRALGPDHVYPIFLPYGELNNKGIEDALLVTSFLKIPLDHIQTVNIQPMVDSIVLYEPSLDQLRKGNIMARVRMIVTYDQAKKRRALVVGTENKSEHYLGYFTRFGDEASDLEPLRNYYKTEIYQLATELGLPQEILTKAPTAGLWEGQTDESEFGFSYKEADEILYLAVDEGKREEEIIQKGISPALVTKVLQHKKRNAFKLALPYLPIA